MIVFRTFLKILKSCKAPIILYTVLLVFFAGFNMESNDSTSNFTAEKPDLLIVNHDESFGFTQHLIDYLEENTNVVTTLDNEDQINDALFYRNLNYVIYIPEHFREDFLNHKNPQIQVKSTGDYMGSLTEMMLSQYLRLADIYNTIFEDEDEMLEHLSKSLSNKTKVEVTSKLDTNQLSRIATYYNFLNYCILAGCVYVVCLILFSFKKDTIRKRTIVSSMNYRSYNRQLLFSNSLFVFVLWLFYVLLSFLLFGTSMVTLHGMFYILNSLVFSICALAIAFLIGNLIYNREVINGIVNVIALGSSFLCGAFVPIDFLPDFVLKIAHVLPSYWYIQTNESVKLIEEFDFLHLKPVYFNWLMLLIFFLLIIMITNIISNRMRKKEN